MLVSPELLVSFTLLSSIALHLLVSVIAVGDPHTLAISETGRCRATKLGEVITLKM